MKNILETNSSIMEDLEEKDVKNATGFSALKPLDGEPIIKRIAGFDVETYGRDNEFYMGSIVYEDLGFNRYQDAQVMTKVFYEKEKMIRFIIDNDFFYRNTYIFATNLQFDIMALFGNTKYEKDLRFMFRGSRLLQAKYHNESKKDANNCVYQITFLDTLNHFKVSVAELGKLINMPKFEKPSFLGQIPIDDAEEKILKEYNIQDSMITYKFAKFFQNEYNKIGCQLKITQPSSAVDLYRRKYMKIPIKQPTLSVLKELYKGYYGGRTEVIRRGNITGRNLHYYDVNSLYPFSMMAGVYMGQFPNPNYCYEKTYPHDNKSLYQIEKYEGVSHVEMYCPENIYLPYLPVRHDNKLLFPAGYINGWYTHYEIRNAMKLGYEFIKVHKTIYYSKNHVPFKEFVTDMYSERMRNRGTKYELSYKLLMNSLYGKFAQKIEPEPEIRHADSYNAEQLDRLWNSNKQIEIIGNYIKTTGTLSYISKYINPIYSIYITAIARDYLYKSLPKDVYYMDTDSCITKEQLPTGGWLGEWKKEADINEGILVKPKFYYMNDIVKIKGCTGITKNEFHDVLKGKVYKYKKISKFKESIRRGLAYNQNMEVSKEMGLEDNKRQWPNPFNTNELQESKPIILTQQDYERTTTP